MTALGQDGKAWIMPRSTLVQTFLATGGKTYGGWPSHLMARWERWGSSPSNPHDVVAGGSMTEAQGATLTLSSSPGWPEGSLVGSLPRRKSSDRHPGSVLSKVAWIPREELGHAEWIVAGRRLGTIGRCSQWWIGDWIRYGTAKWGEKYAEAARVTGYDVASLRNMAWVASRFSPSLRSDELTWSHHVLLAPLAAEEQRLWLERAREQKLSVADLRLELRALRGGRQGKQPAVTPAADSRGGADSAVCPRCGHRLPPAED